MEKIRKTIRSGIKYGFCSTGGHALLRRVLPSQLLVILRYHSIGQKNSLISPGICVSEKAFEEQVSYFSKYFLNMRMDAIVDHLEQGVPFPSNGITFTFDDGYADNFKAAEVLYRYGMTGVFYITAGCIESDEQFWVAEVRHLLEKTSISKIRIEEGNVELECPLDHRETAIRAVTKLIKSGSRKNRDLIRQALWKQCPDVPPFPNDLMLTWEQLREMAKMGMEIGGHTITHPNLPNATPEEAWVEISGCKGLLEERLGYKVRHFAFPNGGAMAHFNPEVKCLLKQAGFNSGSTSLPGLIHGKSDPLELRRIRATEDLSEMVWEIEETRLHSRGK